MIHVLQRCNACDMATISLQKQVRRQALDGQSVLAKSAVASRYDKDLDRPVSGKLILLRLPSTS